MPKKKILEQWILLFLK